MPLAHQKYLAYNADDFSRWAMSVGPITEKVVQHFLTSGTAPEQGYKACASLTKLGRPLWQGTPGECLREDPGVQRSALYSQH